MWRSAAVDQQQRRKQELELRLEQCRRLAREFRDGTTAKNIRDLAAEIERQIQQLETR
jgi:hypothetical protein